MMVLFSGVGSRDRAEITIAVGIGALAGSTIMLLCIPWFLAILSGRVDLDDSGQAKYLGKPKLTKDFDLHGTGVQAKPIIKANARLMLITSLSFLIVQIPA